MKVKDFMAYLSCNPFVIIKQYRDFPYERDMTIAVTTPYDSRNDKGFQKDYYDKEIDSIYLGDGVDPQNGKLREGIVIELVERWEGHAWE